MLATVAINLKVNGVIVTTYPDLTTIIIPISRSENERIIIELKAFTARCAVVKAKDMSNEPSNRLLKIFHVSIAVIAAVGFNLLRGFCVMRFKDGCTRKVNARIGRLFFAMAEVIDFNSKSKVIDND